MANKLNDIMNDPASWSQYQPALRNALASLLQKKQEEENALSQSTIVGNGDTDITISPNNDLKLLMQPNNSPKDSLRENYLRNNMTGATYRFQSAPQVSASRRVNSANNLISLGQQYGIPDEDVAAMIEYDASATPGMPSAQSLYSQAQKYGVPFNQLFKANQAVASGNSARQEHAIKQKMAQAEIDAKILQNNKTLLDLLGARSPKAPEGYRYTSDKNLEVIPGGPADLKSRAIAEKLALGAQDVDIALGVLRNAYDRLEEHGGITSTHQGIMENLAASASTSVPGQAIGKWLGTENQSARNDIAMTRPALLAALMKATGMTARQIDSNAELKLWLTTATDPTLDVESNRRALNNIERKYIGRTKEPGTTSDFDATINTYGNIPPQAIQFLKTNPGLRDQFDTKYGAGASARFLER